MQKVSSLSESYSDYSLLSAIKNEPHFVDLLDALYKYISDDENSASSNSFSENLKRYIPKGIQQIDIDNIARGMTIQKDLCSDLNCNSDTLGRFCETPLKMGLISKKVIAKPKLFFIYYLTERGLRLCWMLHNLKTLSEMTKVQSERKHSENASHIESDSSYLHKQRNAMKADLALNYLINMGLLTLAEDGDDGYRWENGTQDISIRIETAPVDKTISLVYYDKENISDSEPASYYDDLCNTILGHLEDRWDAVDDMFTGKKIRAGYLPITFAAPACDADSVSKINDGLRYYIKNIAEDEGSCSKVELQTVVFGNEAETINGFDSVGTDGHLFDFTPGKGTADISAAIDWTIATSECYCSYCWQKTYQSTKITKPRIILILPNCADYVQPDKITVNRIKTYLKSSKKEIWAFFFGEPDSSFFQTIVDMIGIDRVLIGNKDDYLSMFSWAAKYTYNLCRASAGNSGSEQKTAVYDPRENNINFAVRIGSAASGKSMYAYPSRGTAVRKVVIGSSGKSQEIGRLPAPKNSKPCHAKGQPPKWELQIRKHKIV